MKSILWISAGAVLGANARYLVGLWAAQRLGVSFPFATLAVNLVGSLALGFLITLGMMRGGLAHELRLFLAVGFLGAFTTFSSFSAETLALLQEGAIRPVLVNVLANNVGGLSMAWLGAVLARWV